MFCFVFLQGVVVGPWAPRAVDGGVCLTLACLGLMLPETFKMPLPDNIQDIKQRGFENVFTKQFDLLYIFCVIPNVKWCPLQPYGGLK